MNQAEEPIILDLNDDPTLPTGIKFEDKDWEQYKE
jgi:hypothetical protein